MSDRDDRGGEFPEAKGLPKPPRDPGRWYKGWPVPWTIHWPGFPGGAPDWTTADNDRVAACLDDSLCGVCGQKLEGGVAFIGGCQGRDPEEAAKGMVPFFDPAMHVECAEYSARICPFLGGNRIRPDLGPDMGDSGVQYVWYADGVVRLSRERSTFRGLKRFELIEKAAPPVEKGRGRHGRATRYARRVLDMVDAGPFQTTRVVERPQPNAKLRWDIDGRIAHAPKNDWFYLGSKPTLKGAEAGARKALRKQGFTHARVVDARTAEIVREFGPLERKAKEAA